MNENEESNPFFPRRTGPKARRKRPRPRQKQKPRTSAPYEKKPVRMVNTNPLYVGYYSPSHAITFNVKPAHIVMIVPLHLPLPSSLPSPLPSPLPPPLPLPSLSPSDEEIVVHTTKCAYRMLTYCRGTLLEWNLFLTELLHEQEMFSKPTIVRIHTNIVYGKPYMNCVFELYRKNQNARWQMKRLMNAWLAKRCRKRTIGADLDVFTMEQIPEKEQIDIYCFESRTLYVFSGKTLMKVIRYNLETQSQSVPLPSRPKNPFSNKAFRYGQMLTIYKKLLIYCANKGYAFPHVFSMLKESNFNTLRMLNFYNARLQYSASTQYMIHDDIDNELFLEVVTEICVRYNLLRTYPFFMTKMKKIIYQKGDMLKVWKLFVKDYWCYSQLGLFPRDHWTSELKIMSDVHILIRSIECAPPRVRA